MGSDATVGALYASMTLGDGGGLGAGGKTGAACGDPYDADGAS